VVPVVVEGTSAAANAGWTWEDSDSVCFLGGSSESLSSPPKCTTISLSPVCTVIRLDLFSDLPSDCASGSSCGVTATGKVVGMAGGAGEVVVVEGTGAAAGAGWTWENSDT